MLTEEAETALQPENEASGTRHETLIKNASDTSKRRNLLTPARMNFHELQTPEVPIQNQRVEGCKSFI